MTDVAGHEPPEPSALNDMLDAAESDPSMQQDISLLLNTMYPPAMVSDDASNLLSPPAAVSEEVVQCHTCGEQVPILQAGEHSAVCSAKWRAPKPGAGAHTAIDLVHSPPGLEAPTMTVQCECCLQALTLEQFSTHQCVKPTASFIPTSTNASHDSGKPYAEAAPLMSPSQADGGIRSMMLNLRGRPSQQQRKAAFKRAANMLTNDPENAACRAMLSEFRGGLEEAKAKSWKGFDSPQRRAVADDIFDHIPSPAAS